MTEAESIARVMRLRARFVALGGHLCRPGLLEAAGQFIAKHGRSVRVAEMRAQRKAARDADKARGPKVWRNWSTNFTPGEPVREMDVAWVMAGDPKPELTVQPDRRHKGPLPLTQIGRKADTKKLPKIRKYGWQTADAGTASQHEQ